jgi:transposase InsO family protein
MNRDFQAAVPDEKMAHGHHGASDPGWQGVPLAHRRLLRRNGRRCAIGSSPEAELVNTMLDAAIETVAETNDRPVVHSDRGGQYRWPDWLSRMSDANFTRSMSRQACSPNNEACESFFGRLKNELFYPRGWRSTTIEHFIEVVDSHIRSYNEKRIKISLGSLSPIEYRESLGLTA